MQPLRLMTLIMLVVLIELSDMNVLIWNQYILTMLQIAAILVKVILQMSSIVTVLVILLISIITICPKRAGWLQHWLALGCLMMEANSSVVLLVFMCGSRCTYTFIHWLCACSA